MICGKLVDSGGSKKAPSLASLVSVLNSDLRLWSAPVNLTDRPPIRSYIYWIRVTIQRSTLGPPKSVGSVSARSIFDAELLLII